MRNLAARAPCTGPFLIRSRPAIPSASTQCYRNSASALGCSRPAWLRPGELWQPARAPGLNNRAAALDKDDVTPATVVLADPFPGADGTEPGCVVQGQAGSVFRENPRLDGPDPGGLG